MKIDFCTFCYSGDAARLHAPGQLQKQVDSNSYPFDTVLVIYQGCHPANYPAFGDIGHPVQTAVIEDIDAELSGFGIDLNGQFQSPIDGHHNWKYHVVNHIKGIQETGADYIVFADNDCWMVEQPPGMSWVHWGLEVLQRDSNIFMVSPNDGEPERRTQRMSQQMFMVSVEDFRLADFNQPGWDGNVNIPGGPMPEYHGMLEGRIAHYCISQGRFRYVLPPAYRYWHHNKTRADGTFETDRSQW